MAITYWQYSDAGRTGFDDDVRTATEYGPGGALIGTRPYTAFENVRADALAASVLAASNKATIETQARNALTGNRTYLAVASPTNAQVAAQVRALTQQMNGVIRHVVQDFTGTN
jgi:hypothetical protein